MAEIASLTPMFAGVSYERLEGYKSQQWPVAAYLSIYFSDRG